MALKARLANLDGLSDEIKAEYKPDAVKGGFVLDVTPTDGFALEDITGLKSTVSTLRTEVNDLRTRNKAFEGLDAAEARDALARVGEMKNWTPEQKVQEQINAIKQELSGKHSRAETGWKDREKALLGQLQNLMITQAATTAIAANKGEVPLLLPHVVNQARLREVDGKFVVEVVDANGNARTSPKGASTDPMTISELVEEMRAQTPFARAFDASGATGSGASGSSGARGNGASGASGNGSGSVSKGADGVIRIPRSDRVAQGKHIAEIAAGTAIVVDG